LSSPVTAVGAHDERGLVRSLAALGLSTARVTRGFAPPLRRLIPNEQSTEELIRFVVDQSMLRSPVPVPAALVRRGVTIVRRQLRALRFVRLFFQPDPKDFAGQAQIVAQMVRELREEGWAPLQRRAHAILMLSNTRQAGLVVRCGYLHLSRAVMALTGSFSVLYPVGRKRGMLRDLGAAALTAPLALSREVRLAEQAALRARFGLHPAATRASGGIADRPTATLPPLSATLSALVPAS